MYKKPVHIKYLSIISISDWLYNYVVVFFCYILNGFILILILMQYVNDEL
jgi:hypothetical protein